MSHCERLTRHLGDPVPYVGPCWVIHGNYRDPTRMRRWRRLDDGGRPGPAEVELRKEFLPDRKPVEVADRALNRR